MKLHLVQESYETFASVVLHYFGLETVRENLLSGWVSNDFVFRAQVLYSENLFQESDDIVQI